MWMVQIRERRAIATVMAGWLAGAGAGAGVFGKKDKKDTMEKQKLLTQVQYVEQGTRATEKRKWLARNYRLFSYFSWERARTQNAET